MEFTRCLHCMEEARGYPCPHCGYDPRTDRPREYALRPGAILAGKYVVGIPLGQGGFGITYIGWDLVLESKVAIKEYFPSGQVGRSSSSGTIQWYSTPQSEAARNTGKEAFLKEARKMSRVREIPQVVHIRDLFQQNDTAYIVMDFVEGQTLKAYLAKSGPLSWNAAKAIFLPTIRAMEQVHQAGLIHRDLSPDNLMLLPDGSVKILDLGAAKDLNVNSGVSSMQVAKNGFSPLEQYTQRGSAGAWSDVYALAATMYCSLTGVLPPAAVDRVGNDPMKWDLPRLTALPDYVVVALQKAMALLQDQRTQTMAEFAEALEAPVRKKDPPEPPPPKAQKKRWPIFAGAAVLALVAGLSAIKAQPEKKADIVPTKVPAAQNATTAESAEITLRDRTIPSGLARHTDTRPGDFDNDSEYVALVNAGTQEIYTYADGGTLAMYFDKDDQERCRIYTDGSGQRQMIFTAEYSTSGNTLESRAYDGDGLLRRLDLNEFNGQDKLTRTCTYDGNGKLYRLSEWEYDSEGRTASYNEWTSSGKAAESGVYSYGLDTSGNYTYTSKERDGGTYWRLCNSEENTLAYESYDSTGKREYRGEYTYDSQGREISWTYYSGTKKEASSATESVYSGDLQTQEIYHSYYNGEDDVTTYTLLYGPRDISIGRQTDTQVEEYVRDISGFCMRYSTRFQETNYRSTSVTSYDWLRQYYGYTSYNEDGSISYTSERHYDDEGFFQGYTNISYSSDGSRRVTEYGNDEREISQKDYDASGTLNSWAEYAYEDGQRLKRTYDTSNALTETEQTRYNENGDVLEQITTGGDGELLSKYEYQYDAGGNQIGNISTYVSSYDGSTYVTTYDANWDEVARKVYNADGSLREWTDYIRTSNEERATTYNADGTMASYTIERFDDDGERLSYENYDGDGRLSYKSENHYDANGNLTGHTFTSYFSDSMYVSEYDADGQEVYQVIYNADGSLKERTEYTYTADAKTEKTYDANGRLTREQNFTYDASGKQTGYTATYYNTDGSRSVYEYDENYDRISAKEYDASGKLIRSE